MPGMTRESTACPTLLAQAPWKHVLAHGKQVHQRRLGIVEVVVSDDHHRAATVRSRVLRPPGEALDVVGVGLLLVKVCLLYTSDAADE